jgi:glycosyltransferase involved in cell wall biosynthesis
MNDKIRFVICAYLNKDPNRLNQLYCCVYSLLSQTHKNIEIYIHHDGPIDDTTIPDKFEQIDSRIKFIVLPEQKKTWGFYDRRNIALIEPLSDWVVFTNDDNYYTPNFSSTVLVALASNNSEMAFCNMVHSHHNYKVLDSIVEVGRIDMGSFISSSRLIKDTEWTSFIPEADGVYAVALSRKTNPIKINEILFVHN